jgi:thymidylate kinase
LLLLANQRGLRDLLPSQKKRLLRGGLSVALVGADGSGKSTLVGDIKKWLGWKLQVRDHYYGIPKTRIIRSLDLWVRLANGVKARGIGEVLDGVRWLVVAKARLRVCREISKDCSKGRISVIDRFPLPHFATMEYPMDGPRLAGDAGRRGSWFAEAEKRSYERIRSPDAVIALQVPIETLRKRKADLDLETHVEKAAAVNALLASEYVTPIDGSRVYEEVLLNVKTIIWRHLREATDIRGGAEVQEEIA